MKQIDTKKLCKYCLRLQPARGRELYRSNEMQEFCSWTSRLARKMEGANEKW